MRPPIFSTHWPACAAAAVLLAMLCSSASLARGTFGPPGASTHQGQADTTPFRVTLWGSPTSYLTLGTTWLYEPSTATLSFVENADSSLTANIVGSGHTWAVTCTPPGNRRLTTGVYDSTDADQYRPSPHARFRIARDGNQSNGTSSFEVRRLDRADDGRVRTCWLRFRTPDWTGTNSDSGEIWYGADTSLFVRVPGDVAQRSGTGFHFGARAFEAAGRPVQFGLLSAPSGTVLADHGDGTAAVDVPAAGLPAGSGAVRLLCSSLSGANDTAIVVLRALNPAFFRDTSSWMDPVAHGLSEFRDERDALFAASTPVPYRVDATVWTPQHVWSLGFQGPAGDPIVPADYANASLGFGYEHPDGWAHLKVQVDGRYCQSSFAGSFQLRRLRHAPDGSVRSLWVLFQQSCGGADPLVGELCWNTDTCVYVRAAATLRVEVGTTPRLDAVAVDTRGLPIDYSASVPPLGATIIDHHDGTAALEWPSGPANPGAYPVTWIATSSDGYADTTETNITAVPPALVVVDSPAGGFLSTAGADLRYTAADGTFTDAIYWDQSINTSFRGQGHAIDIRFAMPFDLTVREGRFDGARFVDRNQRNEPALGLTLDNSSCVIDSATFHIRHLERAPDGSVRSLWATFVQHCVGATALTTGELRVLADTSLYIDAPGEIDRLPGEQVRFEVRAVDTRGTAATLGILQLPPGATFTPSSGSSALFEWTPNDGVGAVSHVAFSAISNDGKADTVVTYIRTFGPDRWRMTSASGDYIGQGLSYDLDCAAGDFGARCSGSAMEVNWTGRRDSWGLQVAVPYGRVPAQGRYDASVSTRTRTLPYSGIDLSTTGRSNTANHGSFNIRKLRLDGAGNPQALWMLFDVSQSTGPGVTGEICFGSPDTSYWIDAPADRFCDPGQAISFAIQAHGFPTSSPQWTILAAPPGCSLTAGADASATVSWPGGMTPGDFPVRVRVGSAGAVDSATTWIHVAGPNYVQIDVDPVWYVSQGLHRRFLDRDATFAYWRVAPNNAISVTLGSPDASARWDFSRSDHQKLVPDSYVITDWSPPYGNSPYGLYFVWKSTVLCSRNARFDIWDATYGANDSLLSFSASLTYYECNTGTPFLAELHFPGPGLPVPVRVSVLDATWTGTAARIRWLFSGAPEPAMIVERTASGDEWVTLGAPVAEGQDIFAFEDSGTQAGTRYGYRLLSAADGAPLGDIAWIDVPALIQLDLQRVGANPGGPPLSFALSVPRSGPLTLEVIDVAGRLRDRRQWTTFPAGRSLLTLEDLTLQPGCYFARMTVAGARVTRSVIVIR